jgi:hypothetical protein
MKNYKVEFELRRVDDEENYYQDSDDYSVEDVKDCLDNDWGGCIEYDIKKIRVKRIK